MITPHFVNVPCRCGATHRLPVDVTGRLRYLCPTRRSVFTLTFDRKKFAALILAKPSEAAIASEGLCLVHKADEARDDQQRCEDCGFLLVSYRHRLQLDRALVGKAAAVGEFWPSGALVGQTPTWGLYLAHAPMSEGRERRCHTKPAGVLQWSPTGGGVESSE